MAAEQLQIQVQANVSNAINGLNDLNKSLSATNTAAIKTGTTGMQAVAKGTGQATVALTNFSRVASDAPFGLIGIANNIDPLVQSFVSLRKETGSGKAALAALTSSLAGGGGLILGISLLTSALQFLQLGFSRWGASAKEAKEKQDELKQGTDQLVTSISKQKLEVEALVNVAKNINKTESERIAAINKLNEIIPDNIAKLNLQNIATDEGTAAIKRYIDAISAKATAELLSNRIAQNNIKLFDNRNDALAASANFEKQINDLKSQQNDLYAKGRFEQAASLGIQIENIKKQNESAKSGEKFRNIAKALLEDNKKLKEEYERLLPTVNTLNDPAKNGQEKSIKKTKEAIDLLKEYNIGLKAISWNETNRGIDGAIERLNLAESTLQSFLKQGIEPTRKEFVFITQEVEKFRAAYARVLASGRIELSIPKIQDKEVNKFAQSLQKLDTFKNAPGFVLESLSKGLIKANEGAAKLGETFKANEILRKNAEKNLRELTATIEGFVNPVIDNLFAALEQGEDPFKALIQSVKQLVFELGKAVVKSLALKAIQTILAPGTPGIGKVGTPGFLPGVRFDLLRFAFIRG